MDHLANRVVHPADSRRRIRHPAGVDNDARRAALAAAGARHGVLGVSEALALGLSKSQIQTDVHRGMWRRAATGVLVAAGSPASWHQSLAIATVSTNGVASHRAAARLHGLDGHRLEIIEVTVDRGSWRVRPGWTVHQAGHLEHDDVVRVSGIAATGLARTLVDLGAVVDDELVEQALDDVLRRKVSERWIRQTLDRLERPGPSGTGALRRVLDREDRRGPLPDSMFERLIERAATDAGVPDPQRQVRVRDADGRVIAVLDAAWPDRRIGSEAQSERWHGGPRGAQRDLDRHNQLTAMGWRMLYATWADARSPDGFTQRLRELHAVIPPPA